MKKLSGVAKGFASRLREQARVRKGMFSILGVVLVLQFYFVRELLAAELIFGIAFGILLALGGIFYIVGTVGEHGLDWAEAGIRVVADSVRRGYASLEEITRKSFRHPGSESAQ